MNIQEMSGSALQIAEKYPEIATALISMIPVVELRGGIPVGHLSLGLPLVSAGFYALIGNIVLTILVYYSLYFVVPVIRKYIPPLDKLIGKILHYTQQKHSNRVEKLGMLSLIAFVAVPLPGSGGVTGALVAYIFGFPKKHSIALLTLGLLMANLIVMGLILGGTSI